jgi:2-dehydropantoate 2-reductase
VSDLKGSARRPGAARRQGAPSVDEVICSRPVSGPEGGAGLGARGGEMAARIGIIGAGAIGSVVGGLLTQAGHDVTLIDQWPEHVEAMKTRGLRLSGTCGDHVVRVHALHLHEAQRIARPFDAVFVAVKSYDTEWATQLALAYLRRPDGVVVDFQNGINDDRVAAIAGREHTLGCVITISAGLYEPGHAMRTDTGSLGFKIGELDGKDTARARDLCRIVDDVAPTRVTTNLLGERWSKLAVNCMVNPLAGLSGLGSAEVRTEPLPRRLAVHVGAEVITVGRAAGYEVEPIYSIAAQRFVDAAAGRGLAEVEADMSADARSRSGGRPSLLQDVMKGRRTEVEYLNGYVSQQGRKLGVKTPFNDAIVATVQSHGVGLLKPDPKNLESLARLLPA